MPKYQGLHYTKKQLAVLQTMEMDDSDKWFFDERAREAWVATLKQLVPDDHIDNHIGIWTYTVHCLSKYNEPEELLSIYMLLFK